MRFPSPSMVVSITALILALGGASFSATGDNFLLGRANSANTQSTLAATIPGRALNLTNLSTASTATALGLNVHATRAPMKVNSSVKVANLNADKLDGLDSTVFANRRVITFSLGENEVSPPIALPSGHVFLMGASSAPALARGSGHAAITQLGDRLSWTAMTTDVTIGEGTERGTSNDVGDRIVAISGGGLLIEVAGPSSIRIHSIYDNQVVTGKLTLIW